MRLFNFNLSLSFKFYWTLVMKNFLLLLIMLVISGCELLEDFINLNTDNSEIAVESQSQLYEITSQYLNGWDYGLTDLEKYIVFKSNEDSTTTVCVAKHSEEHFSYMLNIATTSDKLLSFGTSEKYYDVIDLDNEYILNRLHNGECEIISIPKIDTDSNVRPQTKNPLAVAGIILTSYAVLKNSCVLSEDFHSGDWDAFFDNLGNSSGDYLEGEMIGNGSVLADLSNMRAEHLKKEQVAHNMKELYGDATIRITAISKLSDDSYDVDVEINNISSIKNSLSIVTPTMYGDLMENHVYAGILCRPNYSPTYTIYSYKSNKVKINMQGASTYYAKFHLPKLNKGTYYIKPFLYSSIIDKIMFETNSSYVKYGEDKCINVINGRIHSIDQVDAIYDGNGNMTFISYVQASIDSTDDLVEWGVYYLDNDQYKTFPASWSTQTATDIRIETIIPREKFDYINSDTFTAQASINLGIYKKRNNPSGVFDYLTYEYGDLSEYQLYYDLKPSVTIKDVILTSQGPTNYVEPEGVDYPDYKYDYDIIVETRNAAFYSPKMRLDSGLIYCISPDPTVDGERYIESFGFGASFWILKDGTSSMPSPSVEGEFYLEFENGNRVYSNNKIMCSFNGTIKLWLQ